MFNLILRSKSGGLKCQLVEERLWEEERPLINGRAQPDATDHSARPTVVLTETLKGRLRFLVYQHKYPSVCQSFQFGETNIEPKWLQPENELVPNWQLT